MLVFEYNKSFYIKGKLNDNTHLLVKILRRVGEELVLGEIQNPATLNMILQKCPYLGYFNNDFLKII